MTGHEANNAILWVSDKIWKSLNEEQKEWVLEAGRDVTIQEPKKAFELEDTAAAKLKTMGIKIVTGVDKSSFQRISKPMLDKLSSQLGPHADKIKNLIVSID
jgi:TRAP-type transport system periplasmic protein